MKFNSKSFWCSAFIILAVCLFALDASAASNNILVQVRNRAVSLLIALRPLIFLIAGFGLIGFAWGAIFGKINWKWFANIAIGLFLVANVGLFIDYFASNNGKYEELGYGKYLDTGYNATEGSSDDPKSQEDPGEGTAGESESGENSDCVPGTGVNCGDNNGLINMDVSPIVTDEDEENIIESKQEKQDREDCQILGGTWNGASCDFGNDVIDEDALKDAEKDLDKDQKAWDKEQKEQQKEEEKAQKEAEKAEKKKREEEYKQMKEKVDQQTDALKDQIKVLENQAKEAEKACKEQNKECENNVDLKVRQSEVNCANNYAKTENGSDYNNSSYKNCINALNYMRNNLSNQCSRQNDSCMNGVKSTQQQIQDLESRIEDLNNSLKELKNSI